MLDVNLIIMGEIEINIEVFNQTIHLIPFVLITTRLESFKASNYLNLVYTNGYQLNRQLVSWLALVSLSFALPQLSLFAIADSQCAHGLQNLLVVSAAASLTTSSNCPSCTPASCSTLCHSMPLLAFFAAFSCSSDTSHHNP